MASTTGDLKELLGWLAWRAGMEVIWTFRRWRNRTTRRSYGDFRLPLDWNATPYDRIAVLNKMAALGGARSYLEIGCEFDATFHAVMCEEKVGVDPVRGGTLRMTSDEFFAGNHRSFDLVFIDGLHEYHQVLTDIDNALACLNQGGAVVVHDCLPRHYGEQAVPRQHGRWSGDVWKAILELKHRTDLDVRVVGVDHGCGVILPRPRSDRPVLPEPSGGDTPFGVYVESWRQLGVIEYGELAHWVGDYASRGEAADQ